VSEPHLILSDDLREIASLYALRALDQEETAAFEKHLRSGCAICEDQVREAAEIVGQLTLEPPNTPPPPGLRDRVFEKIAVVQRDTLVVRANEGTWRPTLFPGIAMKQLSQDKNARTSTFLVRMQAGSVFAQHPHSHPEHLFLLEGDLQFDDHSLAAGDYELRFPGSLHSSSSTRNGCMLLLTTRMQDEAALLGVNAL
jgi:quercetin dioxygenase-like cupin family protein